MNYTRLLPDMISGPPELFKLAVDGKARTIMLINLTVLGICFGLSNLYGSMGANPELPLQGQFVFITPALFCVFGIFTMLGALLGFTMIYWAAAKAFGGPGRFGLVVDLIGLSLVPFWLLAPLLNIALKFNQHESVPLWLLIPIILGFIWSFKLVKQSLIVGQGLSDGRATLALACMWIFSISAVYLSIP